MLKNWYLRTTLRAVLGLVGVLIILATLISFETSDKEWYDWVSVAPMLLLIIGIWCGRDSLESFLDGLEASVLRWLGHED